jgi:NAD(P)-dependent dehydrogenase (short-subunit alcohol dehydrogenase family)
MRDTGRAGDLQRAAEAAGVEVSVLTLDVVDDVSVRNCVAEVLGSHGRIDVVVNNAGAGCTGTLEDLGIDDLQRTLDVNFLGVARVTKAVLPAMRSAGSGHVIAVSSIAGAFGQPFNDAYCASKFALEGLYEATWPVAAAFGVRLSLVQAGPVTGSFIDHSAGSRTRPDDDPFAALWRRFEAMVERSYDRAQTPGEVAEVIADVAADPDARLRYQTSKGLERVVGVKIADITGERVSGLTGSWLAE